MAKFQIIIRSSNGSLAKFVKFLGGDSEPNPASSRPALISAVRTHKMSVPMRLYSDEALVMKAKFYHFQTKLNDPTDRLGQ